MDGFARALNRVRIVYSSPFWAVMCRAVWPSAYSKIDIYSFGLIENETYDDIILRYVDILK